MPHKTLFIFTFILCGACVQCRMCNSTDIRNDIAVFEQKLRNCTVIIGFLHIVLFDGHIYTERDFQNLSFPELTEITGYLLLYRVYGLTSLRKLFPNLSVIRGATLFSDYALVIHQMPAMREIGLNKLAYIGRGGVRVSNSNQLCFVETIDWGKLGTTLHYYKSSTSSDVVCQKCRAECNGHCWNEHHCQVTDDTKCHRECIGCTQHNSDEHCLVCRHYLDGKKCVKKCPLNTYKQDLFSMCITKETCQELLGGPWFIFNNECVRTCPPRYHQVSEEEGWCSYCGNNCVKNCTGMVIDSLASLDAMEGCTHIHGNLAIRITTRIAKDINITNELEKNLGSIVEIDEYLKVSRSDTIKSLDFFKSLKVIHGKNLESNKYALILLHNADLHQIFEENTDFELRGGSVAIHDNPQLCYSDIEKFVRKIGLQNYSDLDISPSSNGYKSACTSIVLKMKVTEINPKNVTIVWEDYKLSHNESLIGYFVYYIEHSGGDIKTYDNIDVCGDDGWVSIFVENNKAVLKNLKPFTRYAFYVKTYSSTSADRKSKVQYFSTQPDDPSEPMDVSAIATSSSSIKLSWKPPLEPNGLLSHYYIFGYIEPDDTEFLDQRDYCVDRLKVTPSKSTITPLLHNTTDEKNCCRKQPETFDSLCDSLAGVKLLNTEKQSCHKYMYNTFEGPNTDSNMTYQFEVQKRGGSVKKAYQHKKYKPYIEEETHDPNATSYEVRNLKHFTMYVFMVSACNANVTDRQLCSSVVMTWERTRPKPKADDIGNTLSFKKEDNNIFITWQEPKYPNSLILAYEILSKRAGSVHGFEDCVTRAKHESSNYVYKASLLPGAYTFKIRAVSLAGPGNYTHELQFEIVMPSKTSLTVIILVVVFILCFILVSYSFYCWYRKKHEIDNMHLITSINPDYEGTVYVEDEWEMEREDIEILKELGQGTFGMVYSGFIKSKNMPCAVKTVNEHANVHDRMEFLNEASVMKAFSDAHHVVCLLGVVSRGQPPLVIMELMERGDLKSFLRLSRDSSHCITCAEMYRMAAEIADGMAYLSAKKFVHRDLAARNCMVAHDHTVKIGDFGMARDIYETDYYRKESKGLLPVRWMAPESLADGVFTSDSDVWSYGIVLWEMTTLAEQPYQGLANEQVFQFVIAKGTLERPPECPDLLYEIMEACWMWNPNDRPLFTDIVEKLETHVGQDFRLVSFYHSREGEEYKMNARDRVYNTPAMTVPQRREIGVRWNASDEEEVSLYSTESSRPSSYYPISNQRHSRSSLGNYYHLKKKPSPNSYSPFEVT